MDSILACKMNRLQYPHKLSFKKTVIPSGGEK